MFTPDDFADLTAVPVVTVGWDEGWMVARFADVLPAAEFTAVRRRLVSADDAEENLRRMTENFLSGDPEGASDDAVREQLQRLTRLLLSLRLPAGSIVWTQADAVKAQAARAARAAATAAASGTTAALSTAVQQLSSTVTGLAGSYAAVSTGWDLLTRKVARVALTAPQRTTLTGSAATGRAWLAAHPAGTGTGGVLVDVLGGLLTVGALAPRYNETAKQVVWLTEQLAAVQEHLTAHDPGQVST